MAYPQPHRGAPPGGMDGHQNSALSQRYDGGRNGHHMMNQFEGSDAYSGVPLPSDQQRYGHPSRNVRRQPQLHQQERTIHDSYDAFPGSQHRYPVRYPPTDMQPPPANGHSATQDTYRLQDNRPGFENQGYSREARHARSQGMVHDEAPYSSLNPRTAYQGYYDSEQQKLLAQRTYNEEGTRNDNQSQRQLGRYQDPQYTNGYPSGPSRPRNDITGTSYQAGKDMNTGLYDNQLDAHKPNKAQPGNLVKKKILVEPRSPETISWDNPFPTFPVSKKKGNPAHGDGLHDSLAGINLCEEPRRDESQYRRPQTANSKGSRSSSQTNERSSYGTRPQFQDRGYMNGDGGAHDLGGNYQQSISMESGGRHAERTLIYPQQYGIDRSQQQTRRDNPSTQHSRRFDEAYTTPSSPARNAYSLGTSRSNTLPNEISETMIKSHPISSASKQAAWQGPDPSAGYHRQDTNKTLPYQPANVSRPQAATTATSQSQETNQAFGGVTQAQCVTDFIPHAQQESYEDVFDSYYETSSENNKPHIQGAGHQTYSATEEELPNFEAMSVPSPNQLHFQSQQNILRMPIKSGPGVSNISNIAAQSSMVQEGQTHRSRSQPNLRDQQNANRSNGPVFQTHQVVPEMPPLPTQYNHSYGFNSATRGQLGDRANPQGAERLGPGAQLQNGDHPESYLYPVELPGSGPLQLYATPGTQQRRSPDSWRAQSGQETDSGTAPSPSNRTDPTSPPPGRPQNPDALPEHPTPVRPGLVQGYMPSQASKPPPIRQYNNGPLPVQQTNHSQPFVALPSFDGQQKALPVTQEELQRLRQAARNTPNDQKTQLLLAKKMVEAASVLAGEGGLVDQKTRNKNREKYIFDAHKLVKKLVSNSYPEATFYLADCYGRGLLGLESDPKEAFNLYQSAAKAGHAQSAYRVAVCCEMGQEEGGGTRRDALKAIQWYKRAATLGDTPAMYKMGMIQLKGLLGQARNPREAIVWLKRAAERADEENPHALHELGLLYESASGNDNIVRDEQYSKQLFTQAAELGYKFSQYRLGSAYEYGLMGCPVDPRQSIAWYSKAAVQEEHQSELALSGWYLTGSEGVLQQSDTEAYLWARKAAHAGLAKAEYAMGYFTEVGIGVPSNIEDAKRWYWRAASQNFPKARERLEDLRKGGARMQKSRVSRSAVNKQSDGDCLVM